MSGVVYLDSSAIVKMVVQEPGWRDLDGYLRDHPVLAVSRIATVEVARAIGRLASPDEAAMAARAGLIFERLTLIEFDRLVAASAMGLRPTTVRSLDAIHLASALELHDELVALVSYDRRMINAAMELRIPVAVP